MKKNLDTNKSKLHNKCMAALKKAFPNEVFVESVQIKVDGKNREIDCQMSKLRVMVEFQGIQHYKSNALFHEDEVDFQAQKRRDDEKEEWCRQNKYVYLAIPYNAKVTPETVKKMVLDKITDSIGEYDD